MAGIGINVPQDVKQAADVELLTLYVETAERSGFDSLWVSESVKPDVMDPLGVLNFIAASTQRAKLGVAVLLSAFRSPLQLARELATLDQLSGGRLIVGVGLGNDRQQYARHGLVPGHRGQHFEEGVRLAIDLMSNAHISETNRWWDLEGVERPLSPFQDPTPPIWFGARQPVALERAVRRGAGWIGAGSMEQADFRLALTQVQRILTRENKDPASFEIAKRVYLHVTDDDGRKGVIRDWFGHHYGRSKLADDVVVMGNADECADHLNELRGMGVRTLILHPMVELFDQMETIARDVVPQVPDL